jgi:hypothetical protein
VGDFLRSGNDFLTPRQLKVFNTIYAYNIRGVESFRTKYPTDTDLLNYLHNHQTANTWITRDNLYKELFAGVGERFSDITLHNELQVLLQRKLIVRRRTKNLRYSYEYAANQVLEVAELFTTDFEQIKDSKTRGTQTEVMNLLSGNMEKI